VVAVSVVAGLLIAVVAVSISVVVYLLVRFVILMRSGEELVGANSWSDQIRGGPKNQTPEEAVAEWERRRLEKPWSRSHRRALIIGAALFVAGCVGLAVYFL
jgi:hypothetical protein